MFCYVTGGIWPTIYFVSFWLVTVLIFLNLVISFVLEIYSDVSNSIGKETKRHESILKLRSNFHEYVHVIENHRRRPSSGDSFNVPVTPTLGRRSSNLEAARDFREAMDQDNKPMSIEDRRSKLRESLQADGLQGEYEMKAKD